MTKFADAGCHGLPVVLCLRCARVDFGEPAAHQHQGAGCVPITLVRGEALEAGEESPCSTIAERIQRLVEEFRALRAAFGLPHFDLDCYVRGEQLTLMWRPLPV
ncbi:MAG TPA: hypothetical protein VJN94_04700 [Candidatus Binataceae bacterium]|nr:hypothetical protein [Candidatus Binataceae bacterium]